MSTINMTEISDTDSVIIRNLMDSPVIVITPIKRKRFDLPPHGRMEVNVGDIRECSYDQGCRNIFSNYVQICNQELAKEFGVSEDTIEYNWGEKEIVDALTTADINVLLDALDFAPDGIKEALLDKAVELEIPDVRRREAISTALGVNVDNKIKNKRAVAAATKTTSTATKGKRRVSKSSTGSSTTKTRRSTSTSAGK